VTRATRPTSRRAVRGLLADVDARALIERLLQVARPAGRLTSLSQTLLKLTSPGVPDVYQGTELWDLSLVDPDNRRPSTSTSGTACSGTSATGRRTPWTCSGAPTRGCPKLWVTAAALRLRRERPEVFGPDGRYDPLLAVGDRQDHVVAFLRGGEVLTVAPRLLVRLGGAFTDWEWHDTRLRIPEGRWRCVLSGHVVEGAARSRSPTCSPPSRWRC
jgi:(1->4)-alpha-D-glucan 1-alpha-D-glucosylmutase